MLQPKAKTPTTTTHTTAKTQYCKRRATQNAKINRFLIHLSLRHSANMPTFVKSMTKGCTRCNRHSSGVTRECPTDTTSCSAYCTRSAAT